MQKLTLRSHLIELRNRLLVVALAIAAGSTTAYFFLDFLIESLLRPLDGKSLIYTAPYGSFEFVFKIVLFVGLITAVPVVLYQMFKFIAPALPEKIDGLGLRIITISSLLAVTGVAFAYFLAIPASLNFLSGIGGDYLEALISTNEYLSFFMVYVLGFAIVFQLPLIMSIIDKNHPLNPRKLMSKQKYVIIGSYIVAAILTPTPDAMNQTIMALPMIALYQVGIGVVWAQRYGKKTIITTSAIDDQFKVGQTVLSQETTSMLTAKHPSAASAITIVNNLDSEQNVTLNKAESNHQNSPARTRKYVDGIVRGKNLASLVPRHSNQNSALNMGKIIEDNIVLRPKYMKSAITTNNQPSIQGQGY